MATTVQSCLGKQWWLLQLPHPPSLPRLPKGKPRCYLMLSHADGKEEASLDEHHPSPSQPEGR